MKLYCYYIPPIDYWFGAITGDQLLATVWREGNENWESIAAISQEVVKLKTEAEAAFKTIGWEGDVREGPYFFALPGEVEMSLGYMLKQDNDGSCFIASPCELPNLDSIAFEKTVTK